MNRGSREIKTTLATIALLTLLLIAMAYAGVKVVQKYECPICNKVEEYAEDSAHIHYCTGTDEKPHTKVVMTHRGKRVDGESATSGDR